MAWDLFVYLVYVCGWCPLLLWWQPAFKTLKLFVCVAPGTALLRFGCTHPRTCSTLSSDFSAPNHHKDIQLFFMSQKLVRRHDILFWNSAHKNNGEKEQQLVSSIGDKQDWSRTGLKKFKKKVFKKMVFCIKW